MATSVISGRIEAPDGTPLADCTVTCVLRPRPAFRITDGVELSRSLSTTTDANGDYSFTLEQTVNIYPAESTYKITEFIPDQYGGPAQHRIQVGAVAQTVYASIVSTPPATDPVATYLTQAAGDARYSQGTPTFGDTALVTESRPADTKDAGIQGVYARVDHRHDREIISGTDAARLALTGTDLFEGLRWRNTDGLDKLYDYRASTWLQIRETYVVADAAARTGLANPYEGLTVYQADTDIEYTYTGAAWVISHTHGQWIDHTLTFTQSNANMTGTLNYSRYKKEGRTVTLSWQKSFATGTLGVAGFAVHIPNASLPFDSAWVTAQILGVGQAYGALGGIQYNLGVVMLGTGAATGTTIRFIRSDTTVANYWGIDPNVAIANGDALAGTITYEAAA